MDAERQIRFLYPPFFLLASLLFGLYLDSAKDFRDVLALPDSEGWWKDAAGLLIGGSVAIVVTGFFIAVVSHCLLWGLVKILFKRQYESMVSQNALGEIWRHLGVEGQADQTQALYAVASFDHGFLDKGTHDWLTRRWNAVNISVNSTLALGLALLIGMVLSINVGCAWLSGTVIVGAFLMGNAILAWRETIGMLEFQARRKHQKSANPGSRAIEGSSAAQPNDTLQRSGDAARRA